LKSQLNSQYEIHDTLQENLSRYREELEDAKRENIKLKQKLDEANKKNEENVMNTIFKFY
jgi:hypothetical protein